MQANEGAGLAATQCGIPYNIFVLDGVTLGTGNPIVFIDPEIIDTSAETDTQLEGCLSFPGAYAPIKRALRCTVRAKNIQGEENTITVSGFGARAVLHEYDHLTGKLMIDLMGSFKAKVFKKKLAKARKR